MHTKLHIALIFGGRSAEHEISLLSARNIIEQIDRDKYEIILIGMDREGQLFLQEPWPSNPHLQPEKLVLTKHINDMVTFIRGQHRAVLINVMSKAVMQSVDVVFPILHGPFGEDGIMQGLFRLADVPFIGADVLSSAVCMDKDIAKRTLRDAGLPVVPFTTLYRRQRNDIDPATLIKTIGLPCFVKPANMGSSLGISKVKQEKELLTAIDLAFEYDNKVIIEKAIIGRELECAVLGNDDLRSTPPSEIVPKHEFYTYEAKYLDPEGADLITHADVSDELSQHIQTIAKQAFTVLDCNGMARVDFFVTAKNEIYLNELNTIPGFTNISQYPKMWETQGLNNTALIDELIRLALERFDAQKNLLTAPKDIH